MKTIMGKYDDIGRAREAFEVLTNDDLANTDRGADAANYLNRFICRLEKAASDYTDVAAVPQKIREQVLDQVERELLDQRRVVEYNTNEHTEASLCVLDYARIRIRSLRDQEGEGEHLFIEHSIYADRCARCGFDVNHPKHIQPEKVKGGEGERDLLNRATMLLREIVDSDCEYERTSLSIPIDDLLRDLYEYFAPTPSQPDSEGTREARVEQREAKQSARNALFDLVDLIPVKDRTRAMWKNHGTLRRFIEQGTREDGIRECVEVVEGVHKMVAGLGPNSDHAPPEYWLSKATRRLTALLDKPEPQPELTWGQYRRTNIAEIRPYVKGEDLSGVSVADVDDPESDMGMIARNPKNHDDKWYVARQYFEDNFLSIDQAEGENE